MAVLKMQRISICALKKDRKAILEKLQSLGVVEINHVIEEDEDFKKMDTAGQKAGFEKASTLAEQAIDILDKYVPEKKSMFASLEGKALIEREEEERIRNERRDLLKTAKQIGRLDKERSEQMAEITKLNNSIESLNPWISLDVPLTPAETDRTAVFFGTMPGGTDAETVYGILAEKAPDITGADVNIVSSEPGMVYLAVVCMKEDVQAAEDALRSAGFARPSQMWGDVPKFQKEELESEIADCRARIEQIENEVKDLSDQREKLKILADYYRVRADKYAVLGQIPQSERTFVISGYIPQCEAAHLSGYLTEKYDCMVDVEELQENEEAPVILKNNPFSASVEGVVESYGLPHKGELDPTTIMSFFYVFFFGMMLSDAAYGAIVAIVCAVLVKKFPRMSQGMKKSMKLFFYCGLSTLVWGILFGGYFGNIVDVVSEKFFGTTITVPALWFVPLNDPMKLLVFSLLFGVIHLFVGLGIKGYLCLKDGKVMDFFCDVVLWFMLLIGLILMLLPSDIFASIAQMNIVFPAWLNTGARTCTGVIASVINQMGSMLPNNVIGVIAFVVIFIAGHTLNLAINLLGAYVHTNRLQFVEFFGKFYEGGGEPFNPFKENTKYADVKEETLS